MNSIENDEYWNESKLSQFDFEFDDNVGGDVLLLEDAIESSGSLGSHREQSFYGSLSCTQDFLNESITNFLSEKYLNYILQSETNKDDIVLPNEIPLDEKVQLLRQELKERWLPPKVETTVRKILLGQPYSLEFYRTLSSKKELLSCAVNSADGNAILAVTAYLYKTLNTRLFRKLLSDYPVAASHFIHYLYQRRQMRELSDILEILGKSKEGVMKQFSIAIQNPNRLVQELKILQKNPSIEFWDNEMINNYSQLTEWQLTASKAIENEAIIGESAVESLRLSCIHNFKIPFSEMATKSDSHQYYLAKCLGIHEKQTTVTLIRANAELQKWNKVKELLFRKTLIGTTQLNVNLPIGNILVELQKYGASKSFLDQILMYLNSNERIKALAFLSPQ